MAQGRAQTPGAEGDPTKIMGVGRWDKVITITVKRDREEPKQFACQEFVLVMDDGQKITEYVHCDVKLMAYTAVKARNNVIERHKSEQEKEDSK